MRPEPRQQKQSPKKRKDYDYNKPVGRCAVCYTLSGWHCEGCGSDFCQMHFGEHKEKNLCKTC